MLAVIATFFSACSSTPYNYELSDYITIPDGWQSIVITDEEVSAKATAKIEETRKNRAEENKLNGQAAKVGNLINVSYKCYYETTYNKENSQPIAELTDDNASLVIGDNRFPHEFDWALRGKYVNDSFLVRLTLPQDFDIPELSFKSVVFEITINSISSLVMPEYDDSYVAEISLCSTVAEYEEMMLEEARKELIWEKIVEMAVITDYPTDELAVYERNFVSYYTSIAAELGLTLEQYVNRKYLTTLENFHSEASEYSKNTVKRDLLLYSFLREYNLHLSDDEYRTGAAKYISMYQMKSLAALEGSFGSEYIRKSVSLDKVLNYIISSLTTDSQSEAADEIPSTK